MLAKPQRFPNTKNVEFEKLKKSLCVTFCFYICPNICSMSRIKFFGVVIVYLLLKMIRLFLVRSLTVLFSKSTMKMLEYCLFECSFLDLICDFEEAFLYLLLIVSLQKVLVHLRFWE